MKKLFLLLGLLLTSQLAYGANDKPIVLKSGKFQQLPAADTLIVSASTTANASLNLPHGTAPTSPADGDCWTTTAGMYCRINGATVGPYGAGLSAISTSNVLANYTGSSAVPVATTITTVLDSLSNTQGAVLYRNGSAWVALAPGTSGQVLQSGGAAANPSWITPSSGSAAWTLAGSWTYSTNVANVDFTGLSSYNELLVIIRGVTASVSGVRRIQVSTDNGSSFYNGASDYLKISDIGVEANADTPAIAYHSTNSTAARTVIAHLVNTKGAVKATTFNNIASAARILFVGSSSDINAIRVDNHAGGNLTAGNIYVYAR